MSHRPDRSPPPGRDDPGPIEPGSALHRLLVMVAEAIVRARAQGTDEPTEKPAREHGPGEGTAPEPPAE